MFFGVMKRFTLTLDVILLEPETELIEWTEISFCL